MEKLIELFPYKHIELHRNDQTLRVYPMRYIWQIVQVRPVCYCECVVQLDNHYFKVGVMSSESPVKLFYVLQETYSILALRTINTDYLVRPDFIIAKTRDVCSGYMSSSRIYSMLGERVDIFFMYAKRLTSSLRGVGELPTHVRCEYRRTVDRFKCNVHLDENVCLCPSFTKFVLMRARGNANVS